MQKWNYDIIGTHLTVMIDTSDDCTRVFQDIEIRLWQFEARFSRFIEENWLYTLNMSRRAMLDEDAHMMLSFALDLARNTDGYFDPTVGKRLTELGYWNSRLSIQDPKWEIGYGNYRDIQIIWDEVILHGDIFLEFGGVGKGYLIDVIKNIIDRSFCHTEERSIQDSITQSMDSSYRQNNGSKVNTRYLINFGWDMYGCGGWKVGLESPFTSDEVIGTYILDDGFLACSAWTKRKWWTHHHLINPRTGESAMEVIASYVEWASWIITDAYATTLCVMPWELACATLEKTPEISGAIVKHDGTCYRKQDSWCVLF